MKVGTKYPTNEHMGSLIKLISWWFSQWAISKHFWILRNTILIAALPQSKSPFFCGNPSLIYLCTNRPFGFSAHASLFLGCLFSFFVPFFFAYCFTARLKLELCSKWMKFFISLRKKNSLAQVSAFDPNGLSKYVMLARFGFIEKEDK